VFSSTEAPRISLGSTSCYFKGCTIKAAAKGPDTVAYSGGFGKEVYPRSPIELSTEYNETVGVFPPFNAVGLEDVTFDVPKDLPAVLVDAKSSADSEPDVKAEQRVYSDAPVGVFVLLSGVNPNDTVVVKVGGNLDAATAVTPPLNRAFLQAEDALLKQYQAESVRPLCLVTHFLWNSWIIHSTIQLGAQLSS
jgi:hypothetical protein